MTPPPMGRGVSLPIGEVSGEGLCPLHGTFFLNFSISDTKWCILAVKYGIASPQEHKIKRLNVEVIVIPV